MSINKKTIKKKGCVPTQLPISQLRIVLYNHTWYQRISSDKAYIFPS